MTAEQHMDAYQYGTVDMAPAHAGGYLRQLRLAAGLSIEDLALRVDTSPAVSARSRGEMLLAIEAGIVPVRLSTAIALSAIPELRLNVALLAELVDGRTAQDLRFVVPGRAERA